MGKLHTTKPTHPETPTAAPKDKQTPTYPSHHPTINPIVSPVKSLTD
jgi:hypothetical protein